MKNFLRILTPAGIVLAAVLLLVASTGAGAAAAKLVTGKQIKNGSVGSIDIRDRSLRTQDLAPSARQALRGPTGDLGPPGGSSRGHAVVFNQVMVNPGEEMSVSAACPSGMIATGGEGRLSESHNATGVWLVNNIATAYVVSTYELAESLTIYVNCIGLD